jgi:hypothetical protein
MPDGQKCGSSGFSVRGEWRLPLDRNPLAYSMAENCRFRFKFILANLVFHGEYRVF